MCDLVVLNIKFKLTSFYINICNFYATFLIFVENETPIRKSLRLLTRSRLPIRLVVC
jgi:hypothetical protein